MALTALCDQMAYTLPTPAYIKTKFPTFAAVEDATVQLYIDEAARTVDTTWLESDYTDAISYLAAHLMVQAGIGAGADAEANANGLGGFSMIKSAQLTLQRAATSRNDSGVPSPWGSTWYGQQFYWLMRRSKPGISVGVGPDLCETPPPAPYGWPQ
jgi:hypothetical protein